jgi:orotate phosphoribosyltransferase
MSQENKDQLRQELFSLLYHRAYKYSEEPSFKLASGKFSHYYIDCKAVTMTPQGMRLIGQLLYEPIASLSVQAVGGLTMGADPISAALAFTSAIYSQPLNCFSIRKEPKGHGLNRFIAGPVSPGDKVVIVEDVITTGGSTIKAIKAAQEFGLYVVKAFAVVDRLEGGSIAIKKEGIDTEALFTLNDFRTR